MAKMSSYCFQVNQEFDFAFSFSIAKFSSVLAHKLVEQERISKSNPRAIMCQTSLCLIPRDIWMYESGLFPLEVLHSANMYLSIFYVTGTYGAHKICKMLLR